jgi:hypothetical protein
LATFFLFFLFFFFKYPLVINTKHVHQYLMCFMTLYFFFIFFFSPISCILVNFSKFLHLEGEKIHNSILNFSLEKCQILSQKLTLVWVIRISLVCNFNPKYNY